MKETGKTFAGTAYDIVKAISLPDQATGSVEMSKRRQS